MTSKTSVLFLLLCCSIAIDYSKVSAQEEEVEGSTFIDIIDQIPENGHWKFDCTGGYSDIPANFLCRGDNVIMPEGSLNGEIGFWTNCRTLCQITYQVQPGDIEFEARLFQRGLLTEIQYNGTSIEYLDENGWVNFNRPLAGLTTIGLRLDRMSPTMFVLLDTLTVRHEE